MRTWRSADKYSGADGKATVARTKAIRALALLTYQTFAAKSQATLLGLSAATVVSYLPNHY